VFNNRLKIRGAEVVLYFDLFFLFHGVALEKLRIEAFRITAVLCFFVLVLIHTCTPSSSPSHEVLWRVPARLSPKNVVFP
jgi:hypothetical protein